MKVALAQINPTVGDFSGNAAKIAEQSRAAQSRGAQLVVFPELSLCGYPPLDLVERPAFVERNREHLEALAGELPLPAIVGYVGPAQEGNGKPVANCAALLAGGKVIFEQQKMLLPTYDVFDESRYFQPARSQQVTELCGHALGITICEDIWNDKQFWVLQPRSATRGREASPGGNLYERDPVGELTAQPAFAAAAPGNRLLINISASPYTLDKRALRLEMLRATATRHAAPVVYVNQVGGNDSLVFDGSSVAVTAGGRVAAQAASFSEDLVLFDTASGQGDLRPQPVDELAAAYQALVCGTRDYVHKCGFRSVLLGLSGGIDSALVACVAADAVGPSNVLGVAMPGPFSSPGSRSDARALAENLKLAFQVIPMDDIYKKFLAALAPAFAGRAPDVAEENIQARIRGALLMALSNKFGALLLSTGNKSELAVGYCTLYGDMAGGLAVISDVPKMMVYELARHINRDREVIPAATLTKAPSAELRPNQTDQDSLPPYDVLDRILKMYVEELRSPQEIAARYGFDPGLVREIARKVDRNEYKRKQAAPGLKITSKAFGSGRRFPLAQGFEP